MQTCIIAQKGTCETLKPSPMIVRIDYFQVNQESYLITTFYLNTFT